MLLHVLFAVLSDFAVNLLPVVVVVGERIVDLSESKGRKLPNKFLWGKTILKDIHRDGPHGESRSMNDGAASANGRVARNVRVGNLGHNHVPLGKP